MPTTASRSSRFAGSRLRPSSIHTLQYGTVRLPAESHLQQPWRIHELASDFRIEDVWELPTHGGVDDFPRLVDLFVSGDPSREPSAVVRWLWSVRWKLGAVLGWDAPEAGIGSRVPTLSGRLPADLREFPGPAFVALPFTSLYLLDDEFAAEIANRTMHGILHLGWVQDDAGGYTGQLAVYVKPNGLLGEAYMAAIKPFRHRLVYPAMLREIERRWRATVSPEPARHRP